MCRTWKKCWLNIHVIDGPIANQIWSTSFNAHVLLSDLTELCPARAKLFDAGRQTDRRLSSLAERRCSQSLPPPIRPQLTSQSLSEKLLYRSFPSLSLSFLRDLTDLNLSRFFDWAPFPDDSYAPCRRRDSWPLEGQQSGRGRKIGNSGALAAGRRGDNYIMALENRGGSLV
jgi:hypothetical protein